MLLFVGAILISHRPRAASAIGLLAISLLGMAQFGLGPPHSITILPAQAENQEVEVTGFISRASLPMLESVLSHDEELEAVAESYQQIDLQAEQITFTEDSVLHGNAVFSRGLGVRITIYGPPRISDKRDKRDWLLAPDQFQYGQRLRIFGRIRSPQSYGDPGVFDRRAYLLDNGISAVMSAKAADVAVLPGRGGTRWRAWRAQARRSLLHHVLALRTDDNHPAIFSISRTDVALLAAMILGERLLLDERVKRDFQRTGSYHLLVVSGLAIAIFAFAVFRLARLVRLPDPAATIASMIFVALYVSVTDLGAPVQRAALMCAVYMLVRLLYRERNPLNAIGAAALVALISEPKAPFDAGFQMTFLAVISIAGIAVPILERTTVFYRRALHQLTSTSFDLHLLPKQAQFRLDLRLVIGRLQRLLPPALARFCVVGSLRLVLRTVDVIFICLLMQAVLAVPMAVYFHRATTFALPANVAVVPLMSFLLPTAIATTLLSYLAGWVAFLPKCLTAVLLHTVNATIFTLSHFRAADLRVPDPPNWALVLAFVALGSCLAAARRRPALVVASLTLLGISGFATIRARKADIRDGKLEVTAIDVGQGDSLLVVTPQRRALLIDGGGTLGAATGAFDVGEDVVSPYLWSRGFSHLDAVAVSHAHGDHIGGLFAVLRNFHPGELWVAPGSQTAAFDALLAEAKALGIPIHRRVAGERFEFGGTDINVLAPASDVAPETERGNDDSMVMKISYGSASALLEGDAERKTERWIAPSVGPVNLLKVAHHGSATSSTSDLLNRIQPQFAVISAGKFNRYGHPRSDVLERLASVGACTFRTDLSGAVSFYLDGKGVTAARWGREEITMEFPSRWIPADLPRHCAAVR